MHVALSKGHEINKRCWMFVLQVPLKMIDSVIHSLIPQIRVQNYGTRPVLEMNWQPKQTRSLYSWDLEFEGCVGLGPQESGGKGIKCARILFLGIRGSQSIILPGIGGLGYASPDYPCNGDGQRY